MVCPAQEIYGSLEQIVVDRPHAKQSVGAAQRINQRSQPSTNGNRKEEKHSASAKSKTCGACGNLGLDTQDSLPRSANVYRLEQKKDIEYSCLTNPDQHGRGSSII
jgi:hypothetical protein